MFKKTMLEIKVIPLLNQNVSFKSNRDIGFELRIQNSHKIIKIKK